MANAGLRAAGLRAAAVFHGRVTAASTAVTTTIHPARMTMAPIAAECSTAGRAAG